MTTTTNATTVATSDQVSPKKLGIAALGALALNSVALAVGSVVGASLKVTAPEPINWISVAVSTLAPFAVGGVAAWFVIRKWPTMRRAAAWGGLAFGLLSMPMSFLSAADLKTGFTLASMHVITALAWFFSVKPARPTAA